MAGIDWLVLGVDSLAGGGLFMMTTAYAEGLDYLVNGGAFLFFEGGGFFACNYFCPSSPNVKMKICCNTKLEVLFHAVVLVFYEN